MTAFDLSRISKRMSVAALKYPPVAVAAALVVLSAYGQFKTPGESTPGTSSSPAPTVSNATPATAADVEALRQQVQSLNETVKALQQQVKDQQAAPSSGVDLAYGTKVSFGTGGNSEALRVSGWSRTESQFTWTEGTSAVLAIRVSPTTDPVVLKMNLAGLTKDPDLLFQPVEIYINDQKVADWHVANTAEFSAAIPQAITRSGGLLGITLKIPKAVSPKALGLSADPRVLGVSCVDLQLVKTG